ncbi:MAG: DUF47 domain-containing protein [Lachnospiraceae bacterium]
MAKKNSPYFDDFIAMIECSCKAAAHLQETLNDFNPTTLSKKCEEMHKIENQEDSIKHEMMRRLTKEFIPPIDREDIIQMANDLDDITDKIEDILMRMHMYNVKKIRPDAQTYTEIIIRCCNTLQKAMIEFPRFRKSDTLKDMIIEINSIEEEGDRLYIKAVRELFKSESNPIEITAWSKLYDLMEDCCDACEHVANAMEQVMMKNA